MDETIGAKIVALWYQMDLIRDVEALFKENDALKRQRDELLERLAKYDKWITDEQIRGRYPNQNEQDIRKDCRDAIARAEGGN